MANDKDPFTQVHEALWSMIENWDALAEMVKVGNRVKMTGTARDPLKEQVSTDDVPELRIVPVNGSMGLDVTNEEYGIKQDWEIQVSTGDQRVDAMLFPIQWEIMRALATWPDVLNALKWNNKEFILNMEVSRVSAGVSDRDLNRGIKGWSLLLTCSVSMYFAADDMSTEV